MEELWLDALFKEEEKVIEEDLELEKRLEKYRGAAKLNVNLAPKFVVDVVSTIKSKHKGVSTKIILNMLIPKLAQTITFHRILYQENEHTKPDHPNWYSINIAKSGFGKDRIMKEINEHLFTGFYRAFDSEIENYKRDRKLKIESEAMKKFNKDEDKNQRAKYVKEESKKIRNLIPEVREGTREGIYQDAKGFQDAGFGGLFIQNSEFGLFLKDITAEQKQYLNLLNEAYSGNIYAKSIKGENREPDIKNIPVNLYFHTAPTPLEENFHNFKNFLDTGFTRRCSIVSQSKQEGYTEEPDPKKALIEEKHYYATLEALGEKFNNILVTFLDIKCATFKLTDEGYGVFHQYRISLKEKAETEDDSLSREIISRELKALKLSCMYACLNHPEASYISEADIGQAINTIEFLGNGIVDFLDNKQDVESGCYNLFDFFLKNIGKKFNKTTLVKEHYSLSGLSRDKFRKQFDSIIEVVREIALDKGYILIQESVNRNSGNDYYLVSQEQQELNGNANALNDLL